MATVTLRPNGAGYWTQWDLGAGASNYEAVDEASQDGDTTYVYQSGTTSEYDFYELTTDSLLTGATINSVKISAYAKYVSSGVGSSPSAPFFRVMVRTGTFYVGGTETALTTSYALKEHTWTTNPDTGSAWTPGEIDALQAGIGSYRTAGGGSKVFTPYCTQVYVTVDYTAGGGGTTYYSTPAGSVTPAGALAKAGRKVLGGVLNSSGLLVKSAGKVFAGALTPAGELIKRTGKLLTGAIPPVGSLIKSARKVLAGALSFSGALAATKLVLKALAGALTPAGALVKRTGKVLSGLLTPAGAIGAIKSGAVAVFGKVIGYIVRIMLVLGYDRLVMDVKGNDQLLQAAAGQDRAIDQSLGSDQVINQAIGRDE